MSPAQNQIARGSWCGLKAVATSVGLRSWKRNGPQEGCTEALQVARIQHSQKMDNYVMEHLGTKAGGFVRTVHKTSRDT
jgi:hypothetical protein